MGVMGLKGQSEKWRDELGSCETNQVRHDEALLPGSTHSQENENKGILNMGSQGWLSSLDMMMTTQTGWSVKNHILDVECGCCTSSCTTWWMHGANLKYLNK